jgi:ABC-type transport system involved in cytochrome bd biosynthesis fused ATPase/permease subunit
LLLRLLLVVIVLISIATILTLSVLSIGIVFSPPIILGGVFLFIPLIVAVSVAFSAHTRRSKGARHSQSISTVVRSVLYEVKMHIADVQKEWNLVQSDSTVTKSN